MQTILGELGKKEEKGAGRSRKGDGAQWLVYWLFYIVLGWMRGTVRVYRPGWVEVFEVGRSGVLVAVGGGWFSKSILVSVSKSAAIEFEDATIG